MAPTPDLILIKASDLHDIYHEPLPKAQKIIEQTENATINGITAKVDKTTTDSITVQVPQGLDPGPWSIALTTENNEIVALLGWDSKNKKFLPEEEEEDQIDPYSAIVEAIDKVTKAIEESTVIEAGFHEVAEAINHLKGKR